jgi:hypothetical protein
VFENKTIWQSKLRENSDTDNNNSNQNKQARTKSTREKTYNIDYLVRFKNNIRMRERVVIHSTNQKSNVTQESVFKSNFILISNFFK